MVFCKIVEQELGYKVVKEYQFNPDRKWKSDYYIPELKLLIEQEGGVFTGQAHGSIKGILRDIEKYNSCTLLGYRLIRVLPSELMSNRTLEMIKIISKL